jgi:hypothetical protein
VFKSIDGNLEEIADDQANASDVHLKEWRAWQAQERNALLKIFNSINDTQIESGDVSSTPSD